MNTFWIDQQDAITVLASDEEQKDRPEGTERFQTEQELASLTAGWPASRPVAVWNRLPGVQPVKKFTDRKTAVHRIWKALQDPNATETTALASPQKTRLGKKGGGRRDKQTSRSNTKAAAVIALLEQPEGATLKMIMNATSWQAHSVRGFISGQLRKRMGLRVKSFERDGERVYAIRRTRNIQAS